ncbi:MAG: hypothetical protein QM500_08605 [Methylococcales bacterium]
MLIFHCPKCKQPLRCGCKPCKKRHGEQDGMMILHREDDTESCPKCGFTLHVDQWMDVEYEQIVLPKKILEANDAKAH